MRSRHLALCVFVLLPTGCFTLARDFPRPTPANVTLGKTTRAELVGTFGRPWREGRVDVNEKVMYRVGYFRRSTFAEAAEAGVVPAKIATFFFYRGKLAGYVFSSTFRSDSSWFDVEKLNQLEEGSTSRAEVVAMLGEPSGHFEYPVAAEEGQTGIFYNYEHVRSGYGLQEQMCKITFDADDVVSKVETYVRSGR
ncbi:MAG: outer membrane protein assembly factor BamE domain-containing protein [Planctomycetota bacterium]